MSTETAKSRPIGVRVTFTDGTSHTFTRGRDYQISDSDQVLVSDEDGDTFATVAEHQWRSVEIVHSTTPAESGPAPHVEPRTGWQILAPTPWRVNGQANTMTAANGYLITDLNTWPTSLANLVVEAVNAHAARLADTRPEETR